MLFRCFRNTHVAWFRALALMLVGFELVATSRGLVPSICLTLSAATETVAAEGGACHVSATRACCMPDASDKQDKEAPARPRGGDNPNCAFCYLAKACVETALPIEHPFWRDVVSTRYAGGPGRLTAQHIAGSLQGRAPPAFSA